jgi:DNA invertase Pin-like site-specific DNA recombinase
MVRKNTRQAPQGTKAIGYLRVSTDEQALGPEAQRAALDRWCAVNGVELVAVHADLGVSGAAPLDRRPGMIAALADLAELDAGLLLVAKRDRLARDPFVAAMIEAAAARSGARIASAAGEGTEDDGPTSILMRRMVDAFAEYERLIIKARTCAALAVKKSRGERTGGVPYGFALAADGVHLDPCAAEQEIIAAARTLKAAGLSLRKIGAELEARGMLPRTGRSWHAETVKALLVEAA